jgi:hypothetical protein
MMATNPAMSAKVKPEIILQGELFIVPSHVVSTRAARLSQAPAQASHPKILPCGFSSGPGN